MSANFENSAMAAGLEKVSFHSNTKERQCQRMFKLLTIVPISHASKITLKILQARLQQYMKQEIPDVQAGFRKGRETRDQTANNTGSREFQKNISCCFLDQSKAFECGSQQTGKLLKRQEYKAALHVSGSNWSRGNNQNQTWKNGLVQNWERSTSRLYIATLLI